MSSRATLKWTGLAAIVAVGLSFVAAGDGDGPAAADRPYSAAHGYVAHIDPVTGELSTTPQAIDFEGAMPGKISTSSEGLMEVPSDVPGGGTMVHLQGRFQNAYVATLDESGDITATCSDGGTQKENTGAAASDAGGDGR